MSSTHILRVWLPDRPGALGALASRIGAVGGDVLGIEILERGAGRVVDDIRVSLPSDEVMDLLIEEMLQVDGIDIESILLDEPAAEDVSIAAIDAAASIAECADIDAVLDELVGSCVGLTRATWAVVLDLDGGVAIASAGTPPPERWIAAYVRGAIEAGHDRVDGTVVSVGDVVCAELPALSTWLVVGRDGRDLLWRERRSVSGLARVADAVAAARRRSSSLRQHPSAVG